jgi:translation initiation factor IF-2
MDNVRIFELAKKLNITSRKLISLLEEMGVSVRSHMSSLDSKVAEEICRKVKGKEQKKAAIPRSQEKARPRPSEAALAETRRKKPIQVSPGISLKEFADLIKKSPSTLIKILLGYGETLTINAPLSEEMLALLAEELGLEVEAKTVEETLLEEGEGGTPELLESRPPVVTVMGHVDHGKTTLLDAIRHTNVVKTEAGGITQHIGAYQITYQDREITFIDTPGHEAFTSMRARGAMVTDIAVIVVAADDGVKPQTVEAINHARAANVPMVVAINKIDLPNANPEKVRKELSELGLVPEEWGGETIFVEISAKNKTNLADLLEMILLVADMQELKANPHTRGKGVVIESKLDKGRGPVATVLIKKGTLKMGDIIVAGDVHGRARALFNERGKRVKEATPSQPVEVVGLSAVPSAGEEFLVVDDEKRAHQITAERIARQRAKIAGPVRRLTLDDLARRIEEDKIVELRVIIKGDVHGSIEALREALEKLEEEGVKMRIIHSGVGAISESDVMLASASDAIIIGFNVRPSSAAKKMAEQEGVDIRLYRVIYKALEDIASAMRGLLEPEYEEVNRGSAEVRGIFRIPKVGVVAGCYVVEGEVRRNQNVRVVRDGVIVHGGKVSSLRRFKEDARSVSAGFECGIAIENFQEINKGDVLEFYTIETKAR